VVCDPQIDCRNRRQLSAQSLILAATVTTLGIGILVRSQPRVKENRDIRSVARRRFKLPKRYTSHNPTETNRLQFRRISKVRAICEGSTDRLLLGESPFRLMLFKLANLMTGQID
jgi:hypothetical protein